MRWSSVTVAVAVMPAYRLSSAHRTYDPEVNLPVGTISDIPVNVILFISAIIVHKKFPPYVITLYEGNFCFIRIYSITTSHAVFLADIESASL